MVFSSTSLDSMALRAYGALQRLKSVVGGWNALQSKIWMWLSELTFVGGNSSS
jgi:hypothetical protein